MERENKDCIFCKIASGETPAKKIYSDGNFFVIEDAQPISAGHCLVIPVKHYETILDLPSTLGTELIKIAKTQGVRLIKEKLADGFNLVQNNFKSAGQVVNHFHLHVIPRKDKDNISLSAEEKN